jgi:hypothetical protein
VVENYFSLPSRYNGGFIMDNEDYSIDDHQLINQLGLTGWKEWQDITLDECAVGFILVDALLIKPLGVFREGQTVTATIDFHAMTVSIKDCEREEGYTVSLSLTPVFSEWKHEPEWVHHKPETARKPMNPVKSKWGW